MKKAEKKRFIRDITRNLKNEMLKKIDKIPENWNGIELRIYLVEMAKDFLVFSSSRTSNKRLLRSVKNSIIINGL